MNESIGLQQGTPSTGPMEVKGRYKLAAVFIVFAIGLSAIAVRLFQVQVLNGAEYRARAKAQYETKVHLAANRGDIFDRNRELIATTMQKLSIAVDPKMVEDTTRICSTLARYTGRSPEIYLQKIRESTSRFVWLERAFYSSEFSELDTLRDAGLIRTWEPRRNFAYRTLASQIIGFTDIDNNGVSGLELAWNESLSGAAGFTILQKDGRGRKRPSPDLPLSAPRDGKAIVLTLDMRIQGIVESELRRGVQRADAESGTLIAMRPATGEILAMASYPTFNPNDVASASDDAIRNRAITDVFEPGSTFKLVTAAALLSEEAVSAADTVDGKDGVYPLQDQTIRDEHPIGRTTFSEAVEQSSNIVFATIAERVGREKFYKYVRDFGFGIVSGIDLPGEVRGSVKKPRQFDGTTQAYMAFGYEMTVTALQLLSAYATVANDGVMMKPYVVRGIVKPGDAEMREVTPQTIRRVIPKTIADEITELFCGVVERGTGTSAAVPGVRIAGKTGTAQQLIDGKYSKQNYTATFAGFLPADDPQIAIVVVLNKPRNGYYASQVSAPIFQRSAQRLIAAHLIKVPERVQANVAKASSEEDTLDNSEQRFFVRTPDIRGLTPAVAQRHLHEHGLRLKTDFNNGLVLRQQPPPGAAVEQGSYIDGTLLRIASDTTIMSDNDPKLKPDVRGMALRRALAIMQAAKVEVRIVGSGSVVRQRWRDSEPPVCVLECNVQ